MPVNRRRFLASLSLAALAGIGLGRCVGGQAPSVSRLAAAAGEASAQPVTAPGLASGRLLPPLPRMARVALPGGGVLHSLPGEGDLLALTLDDGVSSDVVRLYTQFAKDTGARLTYFVNGRYRSWNENLALIRPLVEAGQIQLANHTWSHPDLTKMRERDVAQELRLNHEFLAKAYGVDARPYLRPPYGAHNPRVTSVAADLGYTAITLWSGTLSDEGVVAEEHIVEMADQYFTGQAIVIGHLNHPPVTHVYDRLVDIIRARNLRTVTLDDVFLKPHL